MVTSEQGGLSSDPAKVARQRDARDIARIVVAVVLVILLVAFVVRNSETVAVHFIFFTAHVRLIWVLLICIALGALIDRLVIWRQRKGRRAAAHQAGKG
jgi:uncharacterized integral membrane protein